MTTLIGFDALPCKAGDVHQGCSVNTPTTCPLCHRPNQCEAATPGTNGRCWCFDLHVPAALLAQLPADQRNTACICRECIVEFSSRAAANTPES